MLSLELAILYTLFTLFCGFAAGWMGATLKFHRLNRITVELEYRQSDLEERLIKEIKRRAQTESSEARKKGDSLMEWAKGQKPDTGSDLLSWQRSKMTS